MNPIVENPRQADRAMSLCLKNGIRIYPVPYSASRYKIVIEQPGMKPSKSDETYPEKSDKHTPGMYDKIREIYRQIAEQLEKPKPAII